MRHPICKYLDNKCPNMETQDNTCLLRNPFNCPMDRLIPQGRPDREKLKAIVVKNLTEYHTSDGLVKVKIEKMLDELSALYTAVPQGDDEGLLTKEDREACVPTSEELDAYLATPDDAVAANLRESLNTDDFRRIAFVLLYAENMVKAQRDLTRQEIIAWLDKRLSIHVTSKDGLSGWRWGLTDKDWEVLKGQALATRKGE